MACFISSLSCCSSDWYWRKRVDFCPGVSVTSYLKGFVVVVRDDRVNYCAITICERVCLVWYRYRVFLRKVRPSQLADMYRRRLAKLNIPFDEDKNAKWRFCFSSYLPDKFKKYF